MPRPATARPAPLGASVSGGVSTAAGWLGSSSTATSAKPERRRYCDGAQDCGAKVRRTGRISRPTTATTRPTPSQSANRWGSGRPRTGRSRVAVVAGGSSRGDVGGGYVAVLVDVVDAERSAGTCPPRPHRCTPCRRRCPRSGRPALDECGLVAVGAERAGPGECWRASAAVRPASLGPAPAAVGMSNTTGCTAGAAEIVPDAMEVTPAAAPPTSAAAATPVTRLFRVTVVLSIGPSLLRG